MEPATLAGFPHLVDRLTVHARLPGPRVPRATLKGVSVESPIDQRDVRGVPAPLGSRALGHLFDGLIFGIPWWIAVFVVVNAWDFADDIFAMPGESVGFLLGGVLAAAYEIAFVATTGATPGRVLAGVRVARTSGESPGLRAAVIRELAALGFPFSLALGQLLPEGAGALVSTAIFTVFLVVIARDPLRRGWHDRAAGTIVVRVAD